MRLKVLARSGRPRTRDFPSHAGCARKPVSRFARHARHPLIPTGLAADGTPSKEVEIERFRHGGKGGGGGSRRLCETASGATDEGKKSRGGYLPAEREAAVQDAGAWGQRTSLGSLRASQSKPEHHGCGMWSRRGPKRVPRAPPPIAISLAGSGSSTIAAARLVLKSPPIPHHPNSPRLRTRLYVLRRLPLSNFTPHYHLQTTEVCHRQDLLQQRWAPH